MRVIRCGVMALCLAMGATTPALARVNIDINLSLFPELVPVPGYPVYYAPQEDLNFFFYDGMYWLYEDDGWYTSDWYDGPWEYVDPEFVPVYVLRVPVRYYRRPPQYFYGWRPEAPPRWSTRWGDAWERRHSGWDQWDHRRMPPPAPLPSYQRHYSGDRYPHDEERREIRDQNYRYRPHDAEVRKHYQGSNQTPFNNERTGDKLNGGGEHTPDRVHTTNGMRAPDDRHRSEQGEQRDNHQPQPQPAAQPHSPPQRNNEWRQENERQPAPQRDNRERNSPPAPADGEREQRSRREQVQQPQERPQPLQERQQPQLRPQPPAERQPQREERA